MKVQNVTLESGAGTGLRVWRAESMHERMRGLLGRAPLAPDEAMLLRPCRLVHTFGMKYPIDVVFLDRAGVVRRIFNAVPRARVCGFFGAWQTLELAAGSAAALGLRVNDTLPALGHAGPA